MSIHCHVISRIVSRLLGDVISLMKHVKLYHGIVGTHIPIHAMSISCNNTDCLSSSWWGDLADETCQIISQYCWHTYSYTCDVNIMWQHGLSFFFLVMWSRWWNMSNYITVLLVHIFLYMRCQYHVTTRIVFLLLGEMNSLMKHVKLYHGIVGTHIPIHAMSISCDNTDCLSSSWWDDLADEACQIISRYCWYTYSYTCDVNIMWQHGLSFFFLMRWSRWWSMSNYITVLLVHIFLYMRCQYHVTTRIVFLLLDEMISLMKHV